MGARAGAGGVERGLVGLLGGADVGTGPGADAWLEPDLAGRDDQGRVGQPVEQATIGRGDQADAAVAAQRGDQAGLALAVVVDDEQRGWSVGGLGDQRRARGDPADRADVRKPDKAIEEGERLGAGGAGDQVVRLAEIRRSW